MKSEPPDAALPRLWCDFNACGWSGEPDDRCYYAFDQQALTALGPREGLRLFAFMDDDGDGEIVGCQAVLERFGMSWRIRPDAGTWFSGRLSERRVA
jgi:hypothetical protein